MTGFKAQGSRGAGVQGGTPTEGVAFSPAPALPCSPASFPCRPGCGACCIALSISSPIPGLPDGKPAGVRCVQLTDDNLCQLFGLPERPAVCVRLRPSADMCGESAEEALVYLYDLELLTRPERTTDDRPQTAARGDRPHSWLTNGL